MLRSYTCGGWLPLTALLFFFEVFSLPLYAQVDNVGAGHAISFDGIDDYIDVGNIYDNLTLPITISAWVYVDPTSTLPGPVFASQDNADLYNGFWFFAAKSEIIFEYGDGFGADNPAYRKGKKAPIGGIQGKWTHVCGVMRTASDVQVYINGINVGGNASGSSPYPMSSNFPGDVAKIGYFLSNGIVYRYKGLIDELRIFNRALSESEIRDQMCRKLNGNESGLIGYWTFDEISGNTLKDVSPNHFDGILKGNPARAFSGAPIGDASINLYSSSWLGKTLKLDDIEVANVIGNPGGVHIYKVSSVPSQISGLTDVSTANPYYGVFLASLDRDNYFDVGNVCNFFVRDDNSIPQWTPAQTLKGVNERREIVALIGDEIIVDLGAYRVLCDQSSYLLKSGITDLTGKSFLWNTGETTPDISITKSGLYSVDISNGCGIFSDTVNVLFEKNPSFSLGPDETLCLTQPKLLEPYENPAGLHFKWQDGSTQQSFEVKEAGTYWVTIENICGASTDSARIEKKVVETVDLGLDKVICDQPSLSLETGIQDISEKRFLWSTGQNTSSIEINKSGIYHLSVTSECGVDRDTVNIVFLQKPTAFDLGLDEELCLVRPRILKPYDVKGEFEYTWQDGSADESLMINDFGVYWVKVNNACGIASDTLAISHRPSDNQEIPNIITPNGDLLNQNFVIEKEIRAANHLKLYNRWGEEIYSSDDYKNDWDGGGLPSGVYFYQAVGDCIGERRGALTISR